MDQLIHAKCEHCLQKDSHFADFKDDFNHLKIFVPRILDRETDTRRERHGHGRDTQKREMLSKGR